MIQMLHVLYFTENNAYVIKNNICFVLLKNVINKTDSDEYIIKARLLSKTNISAELAGGEQRLDGGAEAHNVEHCARRETLQCDHHGIL